MTVRIFRQPFILHRAVRSDADARLAWTRCGLRFAWGSFPLDHDAPESDVECAVCWGRG